MPTTLPAYSGTKAGLIDQTQDPRSSGQSSEVASVSARRDRRLDRDDPAPSEMCETVSI